MSDVGIGPFAELGSEVGGPQAIRQMRAIAVSKLVREIAMRVSSVIENVGDEASGKPNDTAEAKPSGNRESGVDEITSHPYSSTRLRDWAGQLWGNAVQPNHAVERRVEIMPPSLSRAESDHALWGNPQSITECPSLPPIRGRSAVANPECNLRDPTNLLWRAEHQALSQARCGQLHGEDLRRLRIVQ